MSDHRPECWDQRDALGAQMRRLLELRDVEEQARVVARLHELWPGPEPRTTAHRYFRRASAARRLRMALLRRWQLI